jgi:Integrase core domain
VQTLTFRTPYALVFITHGRRELVHVNVTAHPTAAWVWRQPVEATAWGRRPRFLRRDRDAVYGGGFATRAAALGIETLLTPVRAPRANAVAARVIGTLRRECLDHHLVVLNERHLRSLLTEFVRYCNVDRPHRTLRLEPPRPASRSPTGPIRVRRVLGGLHQVYQRVACVPPDFGTPTGRRVVRRGNSGGPATALPPAESGPPARSHDATLCRSVVRPRTARPRGRHGGGI